MADKTSSVLLKYQVDQGSVSAALGANDKYLASMMAIRKQGDQDYQAAVQQANQRQDLFRNIGTAASAAYTARVSQLNAEQAATRQTTADIVAHEQQVSALTATYSQLTDAEKKAGAAADDAAKGRSISGSQIASRVAGLGSILGGAGGEGFRDASQLINLVSTAGVAGGVIGVAALAFKSVTDRSEETTKSLAASAAAYGQVAKEARTATTAQLKGLLGKAKDELNFAQSFYDQQKLNLDNYLRNNPGIDAFAVGSIAELIEGRGGTLGGLKQAADDAKKSLEAAQDTLAALDIITNGTTGSTNDLKQKFFDLGKLLGGDVKQAVQDIIAKEEELVKARTAQISSVFDVQSAATEAASKVFEANQAIETLQNEHTATLFQIQQEASTKERELKSKTSTKLLEIQQQADQRLLEEHLLSNLNIIDASSRGDIATTQRLIAERNIRDQAAAAQVETQKTQAKEQLDTQVQALREQAKAQTDVENEKYKKQLAIDKQAAEAAIANERNLNSALQTFRQQRLYQENALQSALSASAYRTGESD